MKRLLIAALLAASLVLVLVASAGAGPPVESADEVTFTDVDPCTGLEHEVTIVTTFFDHFHEGLSVGRGASSLTTSSGYVGHGTASFVQNRNVVVFRLTDLLADGSGNRIKASILFVLDLSSDTTRVDRSDLTCLGS